VYSVCVYEQWAVARFYIVPKLGLCREHVIAYPGGCSIGLISAAVYSELPK
jgi:hypothetical protein